MLFRSLKFVQEAACCSCVCRDLETLLLRFLAFYNDGLYISLAHLWFSSLPVTLNVYSCRNDLILLDPFLGQLFIHFSQWPVTGTFLLMGSYVPLGFPLGIHGPIAFL